MNYYILSSILFVVSFSSVRSDQIKDLEQKVKYLESQLTKLEAQFDNQLSSLNTSLIAKIENNNKTHSNCESDWISYSDTKCFKVLDKKATEVEAKESCTQLDSSSTLITIESKDEQNFLSNHLKDFKKISTNVWIGLEFIDKSFKWMDGKEPKFENWGENAIKNGKDKCVQMSLADAELGQWTDDDCVRRYLIVCQKKTSTQLETNERFKSITKVMEKQQKDIEVLQKSTESQQKVIEKQQKDIEKQNNESKALDIQIKSVIGVPIPYGFTFIQLPKQKPPQELWPSVNWKDISSDYAGVFFRVEGGESLRFDLERVQNDTVPRISEIYTMSKNETDPVWKEQKKHISKKIYNATLPLTGRSEWFYLAGKDGDGRYASFQVSGGEVRPKNMAIRVWIRIE